MMNLVRTLITSVVEGAIKRFSGSGRPGESFTSREYFQHYGFTSSPLQGAEGLAVVQGSTIFLVASDDRRYRIELAAGEVALYTDEGDFIHLKRNNLLHVSSGRKVQVNAATEVEVISPTIKLTGNVQVSGTLAATGAISGPSLATTGNVTAGGTVIDVGGNTNHHSHS